MIFEIVRMLEYSIFPETVKLNLGCGNQANMDFEQHVLDLYPEIELIDDGQLREKVVQAWVLVLDEGEYDDLRDVPGMPLNTGPWTINVDNVEHTRGVTRLSHEIAEYFNSVEDLNLNIDHIVAGAICHDLGKYFEFDELDSGKFINAVWETSSPTIRHPVYSAAISWSLDFPIEVIHIIANHAYEGEHVVRNQESHIVDLADSLWWRVIVPAKTGRSLQELQAEGRMSN